MTERERVIQECIDHLRGQPGRNAIRALKALGGGADIDAAHRARLDAALEKIWGLNGGEDWAAMAARCQGAMLYADAIGRQAEADEYALLHLIARRMAWVTSAAQLPPQPVQQQVAQ